jgi:hypothetical protein
MSQAEIERKPRLRKCEFCTMRRNATTVCDDGWPLKACNAAICAKHTQQVPEPDGIHMNKYCPRHRQEIAVVGHA